MVVGEVAEPADLIVIGGGPGGYVAAIRAAQMGRQVLLIERGGAEGLGGCCLNIGCIPSKALIELAGTTHTVNELVSTGTVKGSLAVDLGQFQIRRQSIIAGLRAGVTRLLADAGVQIVDGEARFSRPDRIAVATPSNGVLFFEFRDVIIATGSRPTELAGLPVDGTRIVDSTGLLALAEIPRTLAVVGAGYIGLELATAYAKLGTKVTLIEGASRVLPGIDAMLTRPVTSRLQALGVDVRTNAFARTVDGSELVYDTTDGEQRCKADTVAVVVGRRPNTDGLGLREANVAVADDGLIAVAPNLLVRPHIAAIGDVIAGPALAHKAMSEGIVAAEALSGKPTVFDATVIPQVVFTDPEIASVGLTETAAKDLGLTPRAGTFPISASGRAATMGERLGFAQVVVDEADKRIIGVHIVSPHASELIAEGALAVEMMADPGDLAETIHPHPTLSEGLAEAASLLIDRPLHMKR